MDFEELELMILDPDGPRPAAPEIDRIIEQAGVGGVADGKVREIAIECMRKAAERRVEGVTGKQRRRRYRHAASLVAICAAMDPSLATDRWVTRLRDEYRRFPALREELDRYLKPPGAPPRQ